MKKQISEILKNGKVSKLVDLLIDQYVPENYHINIDLSSFPNAMREHKYFIDGKYHFKFALQKMYQKPFQESLEDFIDGLRYEESQGNISTECLDEFLLKMYDWYIQNDIEKIFYELLIKNFIDVDIKSDESVFSLHNYIFKSPILSEDYNFDKLDIRRQLFHRLETITISIFHRFRNFEKHFKENFLYMKKLNYSIKELIEILIVLEEVNIRRNFITEIYFNVEHFFSVIIEEFNIEIQDKRKKQLLLGNILIHFGIDEKIDLKSKFSEILERLNENNENFKSLFDNMKNTKTTYLEINNRLINRRNSLHSNGFIGGKGETYLGIGKVKYKRMKEYDSFKTMGITELTVLMFLIIECCERIIEKTISVHPETIVDRYMFELEEFKNKTK